MKGYSQTYICADYVWNKEEKYKILCFEAGSSRGTLQRKDASFKQVKPWPNWHVEVIPGVSVVGLVTNEELCKVVSGIIIKNLRERERERELELELELENFILQGL